MGILNFIFGKSTERVSDKEFIRLIKAFDNGESWAKTQLRNMWGKNDSDLMLRIDHARVQIYADAATRGSKAQSKQIYGTLLPEVES